MQTFELQLFLEYPNFALRLGMLPPLQWHRGEQPRWPLSQRLWFIFGVACLLFQIFGLLIQFILALRRQKEETTVELIGQLSEAGSIMGLTLVAAVKLWTLLYHGKRITALLVELNQIFPREQLLSTGAYRLKYFATSSQALMRRCTIFFLFAFTYYNLLPIIVTVYDYYSYGNIRYYYQSNTWYPWQTTLNVQTLWCFCLTYFCQMQSSLAGVAFIMAGEFLICFFITQMRLHIDFISDALENLDARQSTANDNLKFIIQYHTRILRFCAEINGIFNVSFFVNFVTSSIAICLMGFSMVMISIAHACKYSVGLLSFLVFTLFICYNGKQLTEESQRLGPTAFYSNWYEGDRDYRRMMTFYIARANQEIVLMAYKFYTVSMETFMGILKFSYQLFTFFRAI